LSVNRVRVCPQRGAKGSQSNNLYIRLAIFGRIASLQITCLAELNGALCA